MAAPRSTTIDMNSFPRPNAGLLAIALSVLVASTAVVPAQSLSQSFTLGIDVPDDPSAGVSVTRTLPASGQIITAIEVGLSLDQTPGEAAFLGDLCAYLEHDGVTTVLLNRPGRQTGLSSGFGDDQPLSVTFRDGAPDIHDYRVSVSTPLSSALTDSWSPDARAIDPFSVLLTDARTAPLAGLIGSTTSGEWNLYVTDLSGGGGHRH